MISSYRLGDLVLLGIHEHEKDELLEEHPNSIGSKYILEKRKNNERKNIDVITEIVVDYIKKNLDLFPKDISDSTVIHVRLGDVVAGTEWHEREKRPLEIEYLHP